MQGGFRIFGPLLRLRTRQFRSELAQTLHHRAGLPAMIEKRRQDEAGCMEIGTAVEGLSSQLFRGRELRAAGKGDVEIPMTSPCFQRYAEIADLQS
ncbi:hypothetical protein LZK73_29525 (plasmid) [Neorhizobium galegae]|nr:hypothetical protein LZK73_29525 [Neorhizobium galegae]